MTRVELKQSLFIIFPLAAASLAIWLFEITKIVGWKSLQWLQVELFSPYIICCLAAACFMTPMLLKYRKIDGKIILTFLTFSLINIINDLSKVGQWARLVPVSPEACCELYCPVMLPLHALARPPPPALALCRPRHYASLSCTCGPFPPRPPSPNRRLRRRR